MDPSEFLNTLRSHLEPATSLPKDAYALIAAATATTLHKGNEWLPFIYAHASDRLAASATPWTSSPLDYTQETNPRRKLVRRLKEALVKCVILCGVPSVIGASLALKDAVPAVDQDDAFEHQGFQLDEERGRQATRRVYRQNMEAILARFGPELADLGWLNINITYGLLLGPVQPDTPSASLTFMETELVVLSCTLAQGAKRESLWHLRGCLRSGMSADVVELVQQAIEMVALQLGTDLKKLDMPRVVNVTEQDDLS